MKKIVFLGVVILLQSCVSKKVFGELEDKFYDAKTINDTLSQQNKALNENIDSLNVETNNLKSALQKEQEKAVQDFEKYKSLKKSYDLLVDQSTEKLKKNAAENQKLLSQLNEKQKSVKGRKRSFGLFKRQLKQNGSSD